MLNSTVANQSIMVESVFFIPTNDVMINFLLKYNKTFHTIPLYRATPSLYLPAFRITKMVYLEFYCCENKFYSCLFYDKTVQDQVNISMVCFS